MKRRTHRTRTTIKATERAPLPARASVANGSACDGRRRGTVGLVAAGLTAIGYAAALAVIGASRNNGTINTETTRWLFVTASVLAGIIFLIGLHSARDRPVRSTDAIVILGVGVAARLILIPAAPFFVSDCYRYLWDGATTASGANPWEFAPGDVLAKVEGGPNAQDVPTELVELARKSGRNIQRINHPSLSTIYPATAQAVFALAYFVRPWSLGALRFVLLLCDVSTALMLILLLRWLKRPVKDVAWYWWNPLVLREVSHSAHMDVIVLPFVLLGLFLIVHQRGGLAGLAMALAVGAKIWPLVLVPLFFRSSAQRLKESVSFLAAFVGISGLLWWPVVKGTMAGSSGFLAYATSWINNDAIFSAIRWLTHHALTIASVNPDLGPFVSRLIVACLIASVIVIQTKRLGHSAIDLVRRSLLVTAAVYFLSSAQFPWYYVWLLPLLALHPRSSLLMYTVLLPLYYFTHAHPWIRWIEHLPVLGWFAIEAFYAKVDLTVLPPAVRRDVQVKF